MSYLRHEYRSLTHEAFCKVDVMLGTFLRDADGEIVRGDHALGVSDLMGEFHVACDQDPVSEPVYSEMSTDCTCAFYQERTYKNSARCHPRQSS